MQICPLCASQYIFYSKKHQKYICEDCENRFDTPEVEKGLRIFISYGHDKNADIVLKIKEYLVEKGYDVWIDTSNIPRGRDWRERITNGLMGSNGVLAFLSRHSVRNPGVCIDELRIALKMKHSVVKSILLENASDVRPSSRLTENQWLDMSDWDTIARGDWKRYFEQKMEQLTEILETNEVRLFTEQMEKIGKELSVNINITKEQNLMKQHFVGREWLAAQIQEWLETGTGKRMMIYGVPGAGKSIFAANIDQYSPDVIASLFLEWDKSIYRDCDKVICQLAYKLAESLPDYRSMLAERLADHEEVQRILETIHGTILFDWLILDPITCCIDGNRSNSMIIIDGLDETDDEIADLLFQKADSFPVWIKFLFLGRYDEEKKIKYANADIIMLNDESLNNTKDLEMYFAESLELEQDSPLCRRLAQKCEGSFMYASALSEAIYSGNIHYDNLDELPGGLNDFYYIFFHRLFPSAENYCKVRPFFELLVVEEEVTIDGFCECLNLDKYELWEMRSMMKSLVVSGTSQDRKKSKILKFVHKSIKDWITNQSISGEYYIDAQYGYLQLAQNAEKHTEKEYGSFWATYYPKWLILSGQNDKYKQILLKSFSSEKVPQRPSNTMYYDLYYVWRYADLLPMDYQVEELVQKLTEIVIYPKTKLCSEFAHRSFQISALLLSCVMDTGRFKEPFFRFMSQLSYGHYFRSSASDLDGETRDGWDKYYMTRDVLECVKKLDALKIAVPEAVRSNSEMMKASYYYYMGKPEGGMFNGHDFD